jgi:hypothetical protein
MHCETVHQVHDEACTPDSNCLIVPSLLSMPLWYASDGIQFVFSNLLTCSASSRIRQNTNTFTAVLRRRRCTKSASHDLGCFLVTKMLIFSRRISMLITVGSFSVSVSIICVRVWGHPQYRYKLPTAQQPYLASLKSHDTLACAESIIEFTVTTM